MVKILLFVENGYVEQILANSVWSPEENKSQNITNFTIDVYDLDIYLYKFQLKKKTNESKNNAHSMMLYIVAVYSFVNLQNFN